MRLFSIFLTSSILSNRRTLLSEAHPKQFSLQSVQKAQGGYGEDNDFGLSLAKKGVLVLHNPYGLLLHLKPPAGGYRVWGQQAKVVGAQRKRQPWELDK